MNLIYMCVFHQQSYIQLLKLLINSIFVKANINPDTTHILIYTSPSFHPIVEKELADFTSLPIRYTLMEIGTIMKASCCKLNIFQYDQIHTYDKILYLDTDVLINSDVNVLFSVDISPDRLFALEEGELVGDYWGGQFFDKATTSPTTRAFSAGVFYFRNSEPMRTLFAAILAHIQDYVYEKNNRHPVCLDQPFLVYNSVKQNKYDNQMMKTYLENNPRTASPEKIIYHFPGGPGNFAPKYVNMNAFWKKMLPASNPTNSVITPSSNPDSNDITLFEDRNTMIRHYASTILKPAIVEIGIFRGEFLDYIVNACDVGFLDGVDLFQGVTCSGNVDGNNLVNYDVGKSFVELTEKYKDVSNVNVHKSDSSTFLKGVPNSTYDIIYIDGDHSYKGVQLDLIYAFQKVKTLGYIMGHVYEMNMKKAKNTYNFGVKQAVDEFCGKFKQKILAKAMDGCVSYCIRIIK